MLQKIMGLADYFIPREIARNPDLRSLARRYQGVSRMLLTAIANMLFFSVILAVFGESNNDFVPIVVAIALTVFVSLIGMYVLRSFLLPLLVANIGSVLLMVYGMTITGGISSPFLFLLLTLPVITITFGDAVIFVSLCLAIFLSLLGVFIAQSLGYIAAMESIHSTSSEQFIILLGGFSLIALGGVLAKKEIRRGRKALKKAKEVAETEARIDMLTGLINRRAFVGASEKMIARVKRRTFKPGSTMPSNLFLAMLDVDLFKDINDGYGHAAGDAVLIQAGNALKNVGRDFDVMARVGGEEFAAIFECENTEGALVLGDRFRRSVEDLDIVFEGKKIKVTISVGLCRWKENDNLDDLLRMADKALYSAKDQGRNSVVLYQSDISRLAGNASSSCDI